MTKPKILVTSATGHTGGLGFDASKIRQQIEASLDALEATRT